MNGANEETLVRRAVAGDRDALNELLIQHLPALERLMAQKIGSLHQSTLDVNDLMQVTAIEACLDIGRFEDRGEGSFLRWLVRLATTTLIDAVRHLEAAKRYPENGHISPGSDESYGRLLANMVAIGPSPSRIVTQGEVRELIDEALRKLPETYREVVQLYYLEGRSAPEIGRKLGRSGPAVHMLLGRAIKRLGESLHESAIFGKSA